MKIKDYKPVNKGCLEGSASVIVLANLYEKDVIPLTISGISVFRKNTQKWITFPSREYEKDGKKKYYSDLFLEKPEQFQKFQKEFFDELEKFLFTTKEIENTACGELPF